MQKWLANLVLGSPSIGIPVVPSRIRERVHFGVAATTEVFWGLMCWEGLRRGWPVGFDGVALWLIGALPLIWLALGLRRRAMRLRRQREKDAFYRVVDAASSQV
jgi:hypothetical protein